MASEREIFVAGPHHIELSSGAYLDLAAPDPALITLEVVAHGLSQTCRFAGQSRRFYSVAEHACLVAAKLDAGGAPPATQLRGLHHDDAEAFIGDVTRPLKSLLPDYSELEEHLAIACAEALALPALSWESHRAIKAADDWALACEAYHLLPSRGAGWFCEGLYEPEADHGWGAALGCRPDTARAMFLATHSRLVAALDGTGARA
jgi:uncharacterized protein